MQLLLENRPKIMSLFSILSHYLADADVLAPDIVNVICHSQLVKVSQRVDSGQLCMSLVQSLSFKVTAVPESYSSDDLLSVVPVLSRVSLEEKHREDPSIRELIHQMETGEYVPPTAQAELPEIPFFLREWIRLALINGVLFCHQHDNAASSYQLVLPDELYLFALGSFNDDMSHLGIDGTLDLVRAQFCQPPIGEKDQDFLKGAHPLELLCMNFLSLEHKGKGSHLDPSFHTQPHTFSHCQMLTGTLQLNGLHTATSLHCLMLARL